jgi:hypothetical protein
MWESITDLLEDLVVRYGLVKIIGALAGLAGALLALGVVVNQETLVRFAGGFLIIVLLTTCVALSVDRRRLRRTLSERDEVLERYGDDLVAKQTSDSFHVKEWLEEQNIGPKGHTTILRWFTLVVGDQPLQTFWHKAEMTTRRQDFKYRKKFDIEVRTFDENRELGVRLPTTITWDEHSVNVFIHLDRIYDPGEEVRVRLQYYWPEFTKELIDRKTVDPTEWVFHRRVEKVAVTMLFDKRLRIRNNFAITRRPQTPEPTQSAGADGSHKIEFAFQNPPIETLVGFSVERRP